MSIVTNKSQLIETIKTVTIAVLITAIVAFIGGAKYQANHNSLVKSEAQNMVSSLKPASR